MKNSHKLINFFVAGMTQFSELLKHDVKEMFFKRIKRIDRICYYDTFIKSSDA